ncbi:ATP-binding protein [Streptomyces violaceusniger]
MARPDAEPGVWRFGHVPRDPEDPDRVPTRQLATGALLSLLAGWLLWSLLWNEYLGPYWLWPFIALVPDSWRGTMAYVVAAYAYYALVAIILIVFFGRLGRWSEAFSRMAAWAGRGGQPHGAPPRPRHQPIPPPHLDPAQWPQLRAAGAAEAADRLAQELMAGRMNDVDHARIAHAWQAVQGRPDRLQQFVDTVREHGAAAFAHGSGTRDLPARAAHHDLVLRQVRVGVAADAPRNPHPYRGVGVAVDPGLLGTSVLAVGPPSLVTARLVRPVVESLCLQALTGQAVVVNVAAAEAGHLPDSAFDVVIRPGRAAGPDSTHGLDLYGGAEDPDEAAAMVAEALIGDEATVLPGGDSRRAATVLAQLLGPYRAAHGRFPTVGELRDLLDGSRPALDALRAALQDGGLGAQIRDLDAYERQAAQPAGVSALLAERAALLDRPVFAGFFVPEPEDAPAKDSSHRYRPFSLQALDHPLRVRIDLPERGHAEASRIIARLILAQFAHCAVGRRDRAARFACLVMDDATQTITPQSLRSLQRLRSAHAGVMLALPALGDVPEQLRGPLVAAVGCRMVCAGVSPWDGAHFAEAWGIEWVETRTVTAHEIRADEPMTRAMHQMRRMVTGKAVTRESVTVRQEQRQRWSASDLANELQMGHAVVSLTSVAGERTPPILTRITD